jgi:hypothetical protein
MQGEIEVKLPERNSSTERHVHEIKKEGKFLTKHG